MAENEKNTDPIPDQPYCITPLSRDGSAICGKAKPCPDHNPKNIRKLDPWEVARLQEMAKYIVKVLKSSAIFGNRKDVPEGTGYIQLSLTLRTCIILSLEEALGEEIKPEE